jgi:tetratricopeptide (TPR) repeat protein
MAIALILIGGAGAQTVAATYSSGVGTLDDPPRDATAFITDATAAEAVRDWPGVLTVTTRGLAWYPQNAELLCLQGYAFRKTGQYQKAVESVSMAIQLDPRPVRYANRGYAYLALRNYSAACADAEAGIAMNASFTTNYAVKALALLGRPSDRIAVWPEADSAADIALSQSPDSAHYWQVKGRSLAAQRACAAARTAYEKSIALDPAYALPWPGFGSAQEDLAALNTTCIPVTIADDSALTPAQPSPGWAAAAILAMAIVLAAARRK